jgi:hypothetical protein
LVGLAVHRKCKAIIILEGIAPSADIIDVYVSPRRAAVVVIHEQIHALTGPRRSVPDDANECLIIHAGLANEKSAVAVTHEADVEINGVIATADEEAEI